MDFGDVLDEWERIKRERAAKPSPALKDSGAEPGPPTGRSAFEAWLDANGVSDKDAEAPIEKEGRDSRRLAQMRPQAVLDLHGMTADEASAAIRSFIDEASRSGLEKVLVIHGKGLHSSGSPVLKRATRRALESHRLAGRFGPADKADGGSGAMWVYVRSRGE